MPVRKGGYWYYTRTDEGQQYAIHCRRAGRAGETAPPDHRRRRPAAGEQVLLDGNALAGDSRVLRARHVRRQPRRHPAGLLGRLRRRRALHAAGQGPAPPASSARRDRRTSFYGSAWSRRRLDAVLHHRRRRLAARTGCGGTRSARPSDGRRDRLRGARRAVLRRRRPHPLRALHRHRRRTARSPARSASSRPTPPTAEPMSIAPRRQGVEYAVEPPAGDRFLILHNDGAEDFALAWTPVDAPGAWHELIAHDPGHPAAGRRRVRRPPGGLAAPRRPHRRCGSLPATAATRYDIAFPEPVYTRRPGRQPGVRHHVVPAHYTSLVTPDSVYDYDLDHRD